MKIFAFDFDGVLAIPYTNPEQLFPEIDTILRTISQKGHLNIISSFNPRSYFIMKPYLDQGIITAIRAGSRIKWWESDGQGTYDDYKHRKDMHKGLHLHDMLSDELDELHISEETQIYFFDDDLGNLADVREDEKLNQKYDVTTVHIPTGLNMTHIEQLI